MYVCLDCIALIVILKAQIGLFSYETNL
jgi:hypothetical protein